MSFVPSFFFWFRLLNGMAERLSSKQTSSFSNHHGPLFGLHSVKRHRHERASVLPKHDFCCSCSLQGERGTCRRVQTNIQNATPTPTILGPWTVPRARRIQFYFFSVSLGLRKRLCCLIVLFSHIDIDTNYNTPVRVCPCPSPIFVRDTYY